MNKLFFVTILVCFLAIVSVPALVGAADKGLVPCDGPEDCTFDSIKGMLQGILDFLVKTIAAPLAIIGITIGAILMMTSAGDPNRMGMGKKVLYASIIGLFLAFGTKAIIDFILSALKGGA